MKIQKNVRKGLRFSLCSDTIVTDIIAVEILHVNVKLIWKE